VLGSRCPLEEGDQYRQRANLLELFFICLKLDFAFHVRRSVCRGPLCCRWKVRLLQPAEVARNAEVCDQNNRWPPSRRIRKKSRLRRPLVSAPAAAAVPAATWAAHPGQGRCNSYA